MEEVHVAEGKPSESKSWQETKQSLPLDFPNLPYLYDGDVKISQSIAILRYLGRKFFLDGVTEAEKNRIDLIEQQIEEWRSHACFGVFYSPSYDKLVDGYRNVLPERMKALSQFLGDRDWFGGGSKMSYVDFLAFEYLDVQDIFLPGLLNETPNLKDFLHRIRDLPRIKKYMDSDRCKEMPLYNTHSRFGNDIIPRK